VPPTATHEQQTTAFYAQYRSRLEQLVAHRAGWIDSATIEDACSHAWMQLLRHDRIDLTQPAGRTLGWLVTTAEREAWRLDRRNRIESADAGSHILDAIAAANDVTTPSNEDLALLHERLDLIRQVPERPRRFLLRLIVGYSYNEIATQENTTYRIVNRQVARAKRLLRQIDARENAGEGGEAQAPSA